MDYVNLKNTIDLHVHAAPDNLPRKTTIAQAAEEGLKAGMKAMAFKSHTRPISGIVNEANRTLGIEFSHSSLVLNDFCGFDPEYANREIKNGIKIIYMPTHPYTDGKPDRLGVFDGKHPKKGLIELLKSAAVNNLAVATGHLAGKEALLLVKEARRMGVRKILVTHPDLKLNCMSLDTQKKLAKMGALLERTFYSCINPNYPNKDEAGLVEEDGQKYSPEKIRELVQTIKATGVENNLLSSDLGQPANLNPVEGFRFYLTKLAEAGLSQGEIDVMAKLNPAKILGLKGFFAREYVKSRISLKQKNMKTRYREPLIGFAGADDPLFRKMEKATGRRHLLPEDLLKEAETVISIFLPYSDEVIEGNYDTRNASKGWALAYSETNHLLDEITEGLAEEFGKLGYPTVGIKTTHHLSHAHKDHYREDELYSNWSQRHIAYICGLGTFGLSNLLITERGCAGRLGSLVTAARIRPTGLVKGEYCLAKRGLECRQCLKNCPARTLGEKTFDRVKCMNYLIKQRKRQEEVYGLREGTQTCGKCSVNIPCESKIPSVHPKKGVE